MLLNKIFDVTLCVDKVFKTTTSTPLNISLFFLNDSLIILFILFLLLANLQYFLEIAKPNLGVLF
tara:strand:+ start:2979 stop:3173 length:195 start_codon:yes stop_codon:yes gene_type:complete